MAYFSLLVLLSMGFGIYWLANTGAMRKVKDGQLEKKLSTQSRTNFHNFEDGTISKLVGKVKEITTLQAPVSKRECVYYRLVLEKRVTSNGEVSWKPMLSEEFGVDFLLVSPECISIVQTINVKSHLVLDYTTKYRRSFLSTLGAELQKYLQDNDIQSGHRIQRRSDRKRGRSCRYGHWHLGRIKF